MAIAGAETVRGSGSAKRKNGSAEFIPLQRWPDQSLAAAQGLMCPKVEAE